MMNIDLIIENLLEFRGCKTKAQKTEFLNPNYDKHLHDPFLLPDMSKAVHRFNQARLKHQKVIIYGDYDIDGLCSVAMLTELLQNLEIDVESYIPSRYEEGYGINSEALDKIYKQGAKLIIAVDCGTNSTKEINHIQQKSVDVIVIDHHQPGAKLPRAIALINPKRSDSKYPYSQLSSSGLVFKFIQALQLDLKIMETGQEKWFLDLAAFGTICDQVELLNENRVLAYWGLKVFSITRRKGLVSLAEVSGRNLSEVNSTMLGYNLGPRLNAAGRLKNAQKSLALLLAQSKELADEVASELDINNKERRKIQTIINNEATLMAESMTDDDVLVISDKNWSHGIVGIVASRLMERFKKPVFIGQELNGVVKGSARSFGDFSAADAIANSKNILISGGGHHAAAGFSLKTKDMKIFRKKLNGYYQSLGLKNQQDKLDQKPEIILSNLDLATKKLVEEISKFEPFGHGNLRPIVLINNLLVGEVKRVGAEENHTKLKLEDSNANLIEGIAFYNNIDVYQGNKINVSGYLEINKFNSRDYLQLNIKSIEVI